MAYEVLISCDREQEKRLIRNITDHHKFFDLNMLVIQERELETVEESSLIVEVKEFGKEHRGVREDIGDHYQIYIFDDYIPEVIINRDRTYYIQTPLTEQSIVEVLLNILEDAQSRTVFTFKKGWDTIHVPVHSILSIERQVRKLKVKGKNFEHSFYGKLEEVFEELKEHHFIRIHHSALINPIHVVGVYSYEVELEGGHRLPVSRTYKQEVHRRLVNKHIKSH